MSNGIFPEWLNVNAGRAFPLAENSSRRDLTGTVRLPDSLIVAAQINMTASYAPGTFFISDLISTADVVTLIVSFLDVSGVARSIATVGMVVSAHTENDSYAFVGSGADASILGSLTIGDLTETLRTVPGKISFPPSATPFEVSALFVSAPALEAIEVYSGTTPVGRFGKILKLQAGENVRLSYVDGNPDVIRIDAISGANLTAPANCANAIPVPPCIRTINGVPADGNGNFNLDGGSCLDVTTSAGSITLTDLCSQSCCGCTELETLLAGLQSIETQITQLRSQFNDTVAQQTTMLANLASNIR